MSEPSVKVVSLQASNIMRLSAVEFEWKDGQRILTIGGKNGAGKSSVLNAVAMALGGLALCPEEPLKRGEQRGFVELNLNELVVRREFWRDLLSEQPLGGPTAYGETKSRLVVKNADGVKQEPAQRLLDKLVGKLTFDPTAFADEDAKTQADILRKIVGLDFTDHDEQRRIAYERRAVYTKQFREQLMRLNNMSAYDDVPDKELSTDDVIAELNRVDALRAAHHLTVRETFAKRQALQSATQRAVHRKEDVQELEAALAELQQKIVEANTALSNAVDEVTGHEVIVANADITEAAAKNAIPDSGALREQLEELEEVNTKVRANVARKAVMDTVVGFQQQSEEQDAELRRLDAERAQTIRNTAFPVAGLGISEDGAVTFNNIALKQASTAEQIRVSVAIGFALNPALKLLCIKNGNVLDDDSFKLIADAAEKAGGQVLMEIVTKKADDVSVFIEDGHNGG